MTQSESLGVETYGVGLLLGALLVALGFSVVVFLRRVAQIEGNGVRQMELGAILCVAWLRFAGYLPLLFLQRTVRLDSGANRNVGYTRSGLVGAPTRCRRDSCSDQ